jgi:hypothetical protein
MGIAAITTNTGERPKPFNLLKASKVQAGGRYFLVSGISFMS